MGDSEGAMPQSVEEAIRERKSAERLMMARNLDLAAESRHSAERMMARDLDLPDSNFNYDMKEMPTWNPNLPKEAQGPNYLPEGYGVNAGNPDAAAAAAATDLPEMMPELYISNPAAVRKPPGSEMGHGRAAAGISSNARQYKMASDIFGTGMDRSWTDSPQRPVQQTYTNNSMSMPSQMRAAAGMSSYPQTGDSNGMPRYPQPGDSAGMSRYPQPGDLAGMSRQPQLTDSNGMFKHPPPPQSPLVRNRNEPSSFKITEDPSEAGVNDPLDFGIGSPSARKARESAGNPVTGEGYHDGSAKTAKRYYSGSNTNQKLW